MKTILTRLTNEQAEKEMRYLPILSAVFTIFPIFIFGFVAAVGLAISGRGLLLTFHNGLVNNPKIVLYRTFFIVCGVLSLLEIVLYFYK